MNQRMSCVLLADRHHGLRDSVRGLLETQFDTVFMVATEASPLDMAGRLTAFSPIAPRGRQPSRRSSGSTHVLTNG